MTDAERMGTPYERTDLEPGEERIARRGGGVAESRTQKITDTPAFKKWFGKSVVTVDGNPGSEPLTVFHGTREDFTEFKLLGDKGYAAFYFSPNRKMAMESANSPKHEAHGRTGKPQVMEVYLSLQNPKTVHIEESFFISDAKVNEIRQDGYDGVVGIDMDGGIVEYLVFSPTQIKSATGNSGDFSPENPDIRYSKKRVKEVIDSPNFKKWFRGSQVVDSQGKPEILYHGTEESFTEFRPELGDLGIHLGTKEQADTIASNRDAGRILPVFASIKKPLRLEDKGGFSSEYVMPQLIDKKIISEKEIKEIEKESGGADIYNLPMTYVRSVIESKGYDGVVYTNRREGVDVFGPDGFSGDEIDAMTDQEFIENFPDAKDSWIAFMPEQVKSAYGNSGDFGKNDPDIRYSKVRGAKAASAITENLTPFSARPERNTFLEIASNPKEYYGVYRKAFQDGDLSWVERIFGLPHWIAKKFTDFDRVMDVEEIRQENRDEIRGNLLGATLKKNDGAMHEFLALSKESKQKVEAFLLQSDKENRVLKPDELTGLSSDEKSAYYSWKRAMDTALETRMKWLEKMNMLPYQDKPWFGWLKEVVSKKGGKNRVNALKDAISNIPSDEARAFKEAVRNVIFGRTEIARLRRQIGRIKFYVPHQREGEYVVDVHDPSIPRPEGYQGNWKGKLIWSERATTKAEGTANLMRLRQKFPNMTVTDYVDKQTPEEIYQAINEAAVERFIENSLKRAEQKGVDHEDALKLRDALFQTVTDDLRARGWERHAIHRSETWVGGYQTENLDKAFVDYMSGLAGSLTKMEAAYHYAQALKKMDPKKKELYAFAQNYVKNLTRNQTALDRKVGKAKAVAFFMYITGKLSMVPVQFTQNFVTGIPQLSRYTKGATRKYGQAMADVATKARVSQLPPDEQAALQEFHDKGLDHAKFMEDISGQVEGYTKGKLATFNRWLGIPFFAMENFNRKSAFLAAYRVFENKRNIGEKGFDESASKRAKDFVNDTHFQMGRANKPELAAGATPGHALINMAYTFNSFTHNFTLSLIDGFRTGSGKEGAMTVLRSLAWLTVFGGMTSIPWWDDLMAILEKELGITARADARKIMRAIGGETLETFGMHGLPALVGFDMSGTLKTSIPFKEGVSETATGVYGGLLEKLSRGAKSFNRGDMERAIEQWSPLFLENALKAYRMANETATTPTGRIIYDEDGKPMKLSTGEAAGQFFGLRPDKVSTSQAKQSELRNLVIYYGEKKEAIYDEFALAKTSEQRIKVKKKIREFNRNVAKLRGAVPLITFDSLRQSISRKHRPDKRMLKYERATE
ncbi:MAG: PLxRFG domain-containing protein [Anaerolineaceae bacterium]|nr:MAG: PLxRFG domain-containing protein [Anaerolineaceae bacterium]